MRFRILSEREGSLRETATMLLRGGLVLPDSAVLQIGLLVRCAGGTNKKVLVVTLP